MDEDTISVELLVRELEKLGPSDGTPLEYAALAVLKNLSSRGPTWEELAATENEKRVFFYDGTAFSVSAYAEGGLEDEEDWDIAGWEDELRDDDGEDE